MKTIFKQLGIISLTALATLVPVQSASAILPDAIRIDKLASCIEYSNNVCTEYQYCEVSEISQTWSCTNYNIHFEVVKSVSGRY